MSYPNVNNKEGTRHIQIAGVTTEDKDISVGYLLTDTLSFEVIVHKNDLVFEYIVNPSLDDLKRLEEKYSIELFKCIYIGLVTQCFWGDIEVSSLRARFALLHTGIDEIIKILDKKFSTMKVSEVHTLIYGIIERADIDKIRDMLKGV